MLRAYFITTLLISMLALSMYLGTVKASIDVGGTPTIAQLKTANLATMSTYPWIPKIYPPSQNFTYMLSNYNLTYSIVTLPPPDAQSVNPFAYNIVVFGPHPFPIQVEFHQQATESLPEKMSVVVPSNSYASSIGCTSYPTQITMTQIDAEFITPTPTSPLSPSPTPTPTHFTYNDQNAELLTIIGAIIAAAVIGAGLGLLIYLIKRK